MNEDVKLFLKLIQEQKDEIKGGMSKLKAVEGMLELGAIELKHKALDNALRTLSFLEDKVLAIVLAED